MNLVRHFLFFNLVYNESTISVYCVDSNKKETPN